MSRALANPAARDANASDPVWMRRLTSAWAAAAVLAVFWGVLLLSLRGTSLTFDEAAYAAAGCSYWKFDDYRLNPENGNLPQRVMALPLLSKKFPYPATSSDDWRTSEKFGIAYTWFYGMGNDAEAMAWRGRAAISIFAVALGAIVWFWSRRLFGAAGGMLSLLLYVMSPTVLANGALMTSDMACAFFFLAACGACAWVVRHITTWSVLLSALATAGLFVSKMSAVLILPIALVLIVARLASGGSLAVSFGRWRRDLGHRGAQALAFAGVAFAHAFVTWIAIWACCGFRFAAFAPGQPGNGWETDLWEYVLARPTPEALLVQLNLNSAQRDAATGAFTREDASPAKWSLESRAAMETLKRETLSIEQTRKLESLLAAPPVAIVPRLVEWVREAKLLPEAYLYGHAHAWRYAGSRSSFLNGEFSVTGWKIYFPYTFLVKTPLANFAVIGLALAAAIAAWRVRRRESGASSSWWRAISASLVETLPLWLLMVLYWAIVIFSHLNIGHRHLLPTYAPLFVLCGAAAFWLRRSRGWGVALGVVVALLALDVGWRFPHYIAYFNGIVSPQHAYRHLVDSSLDWGQDLPGVRRYIEEKKIRGPFYLSYFGTASPAYHKIPAVILPSRPDRERVPSMQIFDVPANTQNEVIDPFLREHPEFDKDMVGWAPHDGATAVMFLKTTDALQLHAGTYFISATTLQPLTSLTGPWGPWNARFEGAYQAVNQLVDPLVRGDLATRRNAMRRLPPTEWRTALNDFEQLRFARLIAFLRQREPDDNIGFSILVYRLTEADLARALAGPPPELGPDMPTKLFGPPH